MRALDLSRALVEGSTPRIDDPQNAHFATDREFHSIRGASSVLLSREQRCFMPDPVCHVVLSAYPGYAQSA